MPYIGWRLESTWGVESVAYVKGEGYKMKGERWRQKIENKEECGDVWSVLHYNILLCVVFNKSFVTTLAPGTYYITMVKFYIHARTILTI